MTELSNEAGPSKPRMLEVHQPQGIAAFADDGVHTRTLYVPIVSPPTPSPSPGPSTVSFTPPTPLPDVLPSDEIADASLREFAALAAHGPAARRRYLTRMLGACSPAELLFVSTALAPLLKRDIVGELPPELALHVLGYVSDHRTLVAGGRVSRSWRALCHEDTLWKDLTGEYGFTQETERARRQAIALGKPPLPYRVGFQYCQTSDQNQCKGGRLLSAYRAPALAPDESGVVTSLALGAEVVVVGLANTTIQTFDVRTGARTRPLKGHTAGVWAVCLIEPGGHWAGGLEGEDADEPVQSPWYESQGLGVLENPRPCPPRTSDSACTSEGWGQTNTLVVTGGCDKDVRVWELPSGRCIYKLRGHTSTVRCARVLHNRPVAVSGSRDGTLRVWDIRRGRQVRVLQGHTDSVRALDVFGNRAVSGSYDRTCRVWDVDTGECLHELRGHYHQIYVVAFDGVRIASAGLDTTVRVWDAETGSCLALLQGHTALVCQLLLDPTAQQLVTGGSDGRVITFSTAPGAGFAAVHRIPAHDSSVTALQRAGARVLSAGNDGRVRAFAAWDGAPVRDLGVSADSVWKLAARANSLVVCSRRAGKTVTEIWSFAPEEEKMRELHELFR